jgi:2-keto-4-pentenoate hydratase
MNPSNPHALAAELEAAFLTRQTIQPFTDRFPFDLPQAYAVQLAWNQLRLQAGDQVVGHKIGLTSKAAQEQFKVFEPDFGLLWQSRQFHPTNGKVEVPAALFGGPRLEGEIAFLLGQPLQGPQVTAEQVLAATEAVAPAFEIVDTRLTAFPSNVFDSVADNALFGGLVVGSWQRYTPDLDLSAIAMTLQHNGAPGTEGLGSASMGHPARAVAWLANTLSTFGLGLVAGQTIISGSLGRMLPGKAGDQFRLEMSGLSPITLELI